MSKSSLLADLNEFLHSSATNVEWMTDSLRSAISVDTKLEAIVRAAIDQGRQVVIAGTAGSGKTHLLRAIGVPSGYQVVPDLAGLLPKDKWKTLFDAPQVIVAGNEGALLGGAHLGYPGFKCAVEALHAIQMGHEHNTSGPTVIDAAGYDPAGNRAISEILRLPILSEYVRERMGEMSADAWSMLSDESVAGRVGALIELASADSDVDGFTFRQLWQFVADLIVGAGEDGVWFARVFEGDSEVSRRLRQTFSPASLPLPHIGNQLWHGDLTRLKPSFLPVAHGALERLLPLMLRSPNESHRLHAFERLRILAAFGLKQSPLDSFIKPGADIWMRVRHLDHVPLLQAINRYFSFGLIQLGDDLELWLQHETERRLTKPSAQISLGAAPAHEFEIVRSKVVANMPDGAKQVLGGRLILQHKSGTALAVSKDLVDGILATRSHRTNQRKHVEYDWRLTQFFAQTAAKVARPDRLRAAIFDFQKRLARLATWQVSHDQIRKVSA